MCSALGALDKRLQNKIGACVRACAAQLGNYLLAMKDGARNMVNMFLELVPTPMCSLFRERTRANPTTTSLGV